MDGPHQGTEPQRAGVPPEEARAGVVLLHGRGATARGILDLAREIGVDGVAFIAPQANRNAWYPQSFLAPVSANEPGRSSGLRAIADAASTLADAGVPAERVVLGGFSQGACLATEFAARNPRRYGGAFALSGGLIGESVDVEDYAGGNEGAMDGTSVFLGCSDVDPHIPVERVHDTREVFEALGADVTERIYEGMGHTVNRDELEHVRRIVARAAGTGGR
ncbi:MAG: dienelactone hydrolase family protein [Haloarculaceae archaeon]